MLLRGNLSHKQVFFFIIFDCLFEPLVIGVTFPKKIWRNLKDKGIGMVTNVLKHFNLFKYYLVFSLTFYHILKYLKNKFMLQNNSEKTVEKNVNK